MGQKTAVFTVFCSYNAT